MGKGIHAATMERAARRLGITKHITPHTVRHPFATYLLEDGYGIPFPQELLGHRDVRTTMVYPAGARLNRGGRGV